MNPNAPIPNPLLPACPHRFGLADPAIERLLKDWLLLAAAFTGTQVALALRDETGVWYLSSSGLAPGQMAALEWTLAGGAPGHPFWILPDQEGALLAMETLPLQDEYGRGIGDLYVLSPTPHALTPDHRAGLRLVVGHVQSILAAGRHQLETRATPRAPAATSFVPGLVHELGSFVFGISANLDAFEARFAGMEDVSRYGATIRKSLDRMNAFIDELRDYGDPQRYSWLETELDALLKGVATYEAAVAREGNLELQCKIEGVLPAIMADEQSLRAAFTHLIHFMLKQEEPGGRVILQVEVRSEGERVDICGHLDGSSTRMKNVDLARLFEPFYFRTSGLGRLTLPVARRVFEYHGGSLTACPGPEGGVRIQFMLPASLPYPLRSAGRP